MDKIDNISEILLDQTATESERDDAAMDLGQYDDDRALKTLLFVGSNLNDDPVVMSSCGESIAAIWIRRDKFDSKSYNTLNETAKDSLGFIIKNDKPEWICHLNH